MTDKAHFDFQWHIRKIEKESERLKGRSFAAYLSHLAHNPQDSKDREELGKQYSKAWHLQNIRLDMLEEAQRGKFICCVRAPPTHLWTLEELAATLGVQIRELEDTILLSWEEV